MLVHRLFITQHLPGQLNLTLLDVSVCRHLNDIVFIMHTHCDTCTIAWKLKLCYIYITVVISRFCIIITDQINFRDAFRETICIAAEWKNIGALLGIPDGTLSTIQYDEGGNGAKSCLRVMLATWLEMRSPLPSWSELANAVEPFNESKAEEIRTNFCWPINHSWVSW